MRTPSTRLQAPMATSVPTTTLPESKPSFATTTSRPLALAERFEAVRAQTESLCDSLEVEDLVVSSMADVSPTKWHLAHTSWFFETFVLAAHEPSYRSPDPRYAYLFNSYYVQAGERHCRAQRGLVTRPTVREVFDYRRHVDEAMRELIARLGGDDAHPAAALIELGLHHEQQHQELLLTDIKHVLWTNPLRPAFRTIASVPTAPAKPLEWRDFDGGVQWIGHEGVGFAFDNEGPRHRVFLEPYRLASRVITNGEYLAFIEDGGYHARSSGSRPDSPRCRSASGRRRSTGSATPTALDRVHSGWHTRARRRCARRPGDARQLLRGRRIRTLGEAPTAERVRMGGGSARGRRRRTLRRGGALPPHRVR